MKNTIIYLVLGGLILFTIGCQKDKNSNDATGQLTVRVTDAPSDDGNVQAVFMTFVGIELDGEFISLEQPKTINIAALTEGRTEILLNQQIENGTYQNIALISQFDKDENGNFPGCYVLTNDGTKHDLNSKTTVSNKWTLETQDLSVSSNGNAEIILDVDLRKGIVREDDENDQYEFATSLASSIRVFEANTTYKVEGKVNDELGFVDDVVIVYAYEKGTFDMSAETDVSNTNEVMFANAVTSTKVKVDGSYEIHFLEGGEYDLVCVSYTSNDKGELEAEAILTTNLIGSLELFGISINTNLNLDLDVYGEINL